MILVVLLLSYILYSIMFLKKHNICIKVKTFERIDFSMRFLSHQKESIKSVTCVLSVKILTN